MSDHVTSAEILVMPVPRLADYAASVAPVSLELRMHRAEPVLWTTSRARYLDAIAKRLVVFTALEFEAAAYAAQEGRAGSLEMAAWAIAKHRDPWWRLDAVEAVSEAYGLLSSEGTDLGRALRRTGRGWDVDAGRGRVARSTWREVYRAREQWVVPPGELRVSFGWALPRLGLALERVVIEAVESVEALTSLEATVRCWTVPNREPPTAPSGLSCRSRQRRGSCRPSRQQERRPR